MSTGSTKSNRYAADSHVAAAVVHSVVSVDNSPSVELVAANPDRAYLLLVNDSAVVVYLKLGAAAVANQGIRLNANGGTFELKRGAGFMFTGAVNGIAATGTGNKVLVTEG